MPNAVVTLSLSKNVMLSLSKYVLLSLSKNVMLSLSKYCQSEALEDLLYIPHNNFLRRAHNDLCFALVFFYHTGNADMLVAI